MQLNIRYGSESVTKTYPTPPTVDTIRDDENLQAVLGFGDNVNVMINGVAQSGDSVIPSHVTEVRLETAANQKATS